MLGWSRKQKPEEKLEVTEEVPQFFSFKIKEIEYLRVEEGGNCYVNGKLTATDEEVFLAMKAFLEDVNKEEEEEEKEEA